MLVSRLFWSLGLLLFVSCCGKSQDTIRFETKPKVILKSWYPEFKAFPELKVGETQTLFTTIPIFENTPLRDNDINLEVAVDSVSIEETEKTNQYNITVDKTSLSHLEIEVWFDLGNTSILILENSTWMDIRKIYPIKDNRVMIEKIKLRIAN